MSKMPDGEREKLLSDVSATWPDIVRLVKRPGPSEDVTVAGQALGACLPGDVGTYRATWSRDGVRLTLEALTDARASRAIVLGRRWVRYFGGPSTGGTGVIDAFDPSFMVTLPTIDWDVLAVPGDFSSSMSYGHGVFSVTVAGYGVAWKGTGVAVIDPDGALIHRAGQDTLVVEALCAGLGA
jgi:hypothetical protein